MSTDHVTLDKNFDHAEAEQRLYAAWEEAGCFKPSDKPDAENYAIVIPPPNVTGSLHMGHALNNTLQDILCRFERLRGKNVLWQVGTDHAGIATQMVVERQMAERQEPGRREIGREAFLEKVWAWKEKSGGTIQSQLRRLGASVDWERERFTMDEGLSKAVRKTFVELYNQGLIYRDKRLVNWDPKFLTAISDLEVEQVDIDGKMWYFNYPLEDGATFTYIEKDEDGNVTLKEERSYVTVGTTRPETMLGDMAVAVHPKDERYTDLVGKNVILPIVGRKIQIVADDYADPEQGSGAVKITPAHDFNDYDVGRRAGIKPSDMINILTIDAKIVDDVDGVPVEYHGLDRFDARKEIVAKFEELGLLDKIEDNKHVVPHGDRSGVVIEPYLTDQWYVNAEEMAKPAIAAVKSGKTQFVPESWDKTYFQWMDNIQPWCISRQLWWGHQIPVWYGPKGEVFCAETEEEAQKLAGAGVNIMRDEDVLDTWFSSALWPFSTLGWPEDNEVLDRFYPTATLSTAFDIIFFWVARMIMMGTHFMDGEVPFKKVYIHAIVRDENGKKMSKSEGNVIDPVDLIQGIGIDELVKKRTSDLRQPALAPKIEAFTRKQYPNGFDAFGTDALRFTLSAMAAQGRDLKLSVDRVAGYRNFSTKLWNATRFMQMNECQYGDDFDPAAVKLALNKWLIHEASACARDLEIALDAFRFNDAAAVIYRFVWNIYCDWFLEFAKPVFNGEDEAAKAETRATTAWALDQILIMLHPMMPFITEELWAKTAERDDFVMQASWPSKAYTFEEAAADMNWTIDLISEIRSVRTEMNVPPGAKVPLMMVGGDAKAKGNVAENQSLIMRLARLESIAEGTEPPKGAVQIVHGDTTFAMPLGGVIDVEAETARLNKEMAKLTGEATGIEKKLGNENFVKKAPVEVVEEQRARQVEIAEKVRILTDAVERLKAL